MGKVYRLLSDGSFFLLVEDIMNYQKYHARPPVQVSKKIDCFCSQNAQGQKFRIDPETPVIEVVQC